jgi:hypothetical protein
MNRLSRFTGRARPKLSRAQRGLVAELHRRGADHAGRAIVVHRSRPALEQLIAMGAVREAAPGRFYLEEAALVGVARGRVWSGLRFTLVVVLGSLLLAWLYSPSTGLMIALVLLILDRLLLILESRGWVNYRRTGLSRGAATYHTLELSSAFDPGFEDVMEVKYAEEKQEDDSGAPPAPDDEGS